ncbi:MAG: DMT family transporter [Gammaproteobacteria bacterium]|nr:DMT family transporter [Gammaproteobacteria bacterium]
MKAARRWWQRLSGNIRGALLVVVAALGFTTMGVCVKSVDRLSVWELVALRSLVGLMFMAPALYRAGRMVFVTQRFHAHLLRSGLGMAGMVCFFLTITHVELTLATALGFSRVLFVTILAVLLLGEVVRWRRTLATVVGFLGVLICIQPGAESFNPWAVVGVLAALFGAGVTTAVKRLTDTEAPLTIVLWTYVLMGAMATLPALYTWLTPTPVELALIALMGASSALAQTCTVMALKVGEASAVTPFDYTRLPWAALLGFYVFGELPTLHTWLGAAVIMGSTLYIAMREARLRAEARRRQRAGRS